MQGFYTFLITFGLSFTPYIAGQCPLMPITFTRSSPCNLPDNSFSILGFSVSAGIPGQCCFYDQIPEFKGYCYNNIIHCPNGNVYTPKYYEYNLGESYLSMIDAVQLPNTESTHRFCYTTRVRTFDCGCICEIAARFAEGLPVGCRCITV